LLHFEAAILHFSSTGGTPNEESIEKILQLIKNLLINTYLVTGRPNLTGLSGNYQTKEMNHWTKVASQVKT